MRRAAITGVGKYLPDGILTNQDLEKMVDTNDEWITSRTGIKQRHILKDKDKATTFMATQATLKLIEKTNLDPKEIDLIITGTVTADMRFPDTSNQVAANVGASNAFGYDINAACSGFLYSLATASSFIQSGMYKKIVVIGADTMSSIVDYTNRATCIIFGDGAAAVLLEADEEGYGVHDQVLKGDGTGLQYLHLKLGGSLNEVTRENVDSADKYLFQDGRPVFKKAVTGMSSTMKEVMERNNLSKEDITWVVPHQANKRIINAVADQLDFPHERVMMVIENYGNTTSATIPLCLADYESQLRKGDNLIITAFGGGFTWGSIYLKWAYDGNA